jgi:hypothetical protein
MKRSDAPAQLSRDHHHGVVIAQRLNRAIETTVAFLTSRDTEGRDRF